MSLTMLVPAVVPSVFQSSAPVLLVDAWKYIVPLYTKRPLHELENETPVASTYGLLVEVERLVLKAHTR